MTLKTLALLQRARGVVFDLDGVLWESSKTHEVAYEKAFAELGIELPAGFYNSIAGKTTQDGVSRLLSSYSSYSLANSDFQELIKRKREIAAYELRSVKPDPEVWPTIRTLRTRGYKIGLATSASFSTMLLFLRQLSEPLFDATVCGEEVCRGKPSPDLFLEAASRLSVRPSDCVVVEDSISGLQAASSCGMRGIAYRTDAGDIEGASFKCETLSEVCAYLISS